MSAADDNALEQGPENDTHGRAAAPPVEPQEVNPDLGRTVAGRYVIDGLLGESSTARTFRARRSADGQWVVLKFLRDPTRSKQELARRITRETDALVAVDHPNVVRVFEHASDADGALFVCREFVEGDHLLAAAQRAPLTPRRTCELLMQVLSGLAEAHRSGILHRNLKPQNIIVSRDASGRELVRLCDFGGPAGPQSGAEYKAPEQAATGSSVDGQADVYAVGVLLYELLSERVPFLGSNAEETMKLHTSQPLIRPSELRTDRPVPRELEAVCLKALAKDARARHRSPREMSQALRAVISLLDTRADEPFGSSLFVAGGRKVADTASNERLTMPGEQLRSLTKFWLGAALLGAVCLALWFNPDDERTVEGARTLPPFVTGHAEQLGAGSKALETGIARLRAHNAEGAVADLRAARRELGDTREVLRALGEALVLKGDVSEGASLLERYLELEPTAPDRSFVESLVRQREQEPE